MDEQKLLNADEFIKSLHKESKPEKQKLTDKQKLALTRKQLKAVKNDFQAMKEQYNLVVEEYIKLRKEYDKIYDIAQQQQQKIKQYQ